MPVPESQLETWSHQGSIQQSSATYRTVRAALEEKKAAYADEKFEVFLQGSYGNNTNIFAESDVDVVIRLDSIWRSDLSALPPDQRAAYNQTYSNATNTFSEFKAGVVTRLSNAFGANSVRSGNKAIKITANSARRSADVVACYQFRRYIRFISDYDQAYVPGVIFPTASSGEIFNYPQRHSENCTAKHQATNGWFKPMVRILKNMRSRLVDDGVLTKDVAPSYFLEGLLWNIPNDKFSGTYQDSFCNCINWVFQTDCSKLKCANEQYWLVGNGNVQWVQQNYQTFLNAVVSLWKEW